MADKPLVAGPCARHSYGGRAASRTVTIKGAGTFHVCLECSQRMHTAGLIRGGSDTPLVSENPRQRCQCEHDSHFFGDVAKQEVL